jgi:hypothetical protein
MILKFAVEGLGGKGMSMGLGDGLGVMRECALDFREGNKCDCWSVSSNWRI